MRIKLLFILFLVISTLTQSGFAQTYVISESGHGKSAEEDFELKGQVKKLKHYNVHYDIQDFYENRKTDPNFGIEKILQFNEEGFLTDEREYFIDGSFFFAKSYTYHRGKYLKVAKDWDKNMELERKEIFTFEDSLLKLKKVVVPEEQLEVIHKFNYNNDNLLISTLYYQGDTVVGRDEYAYDDAGNKISDRWINSVGKEYGKKTRKFYGNGNIKELKKYYDGNKTPNKLERWSKNGLLTAEIMYDYNGEEEIKKLWEYDSLGKCVSYFHQTNIYYPNKVSIEISYDYEYDDQNRLIKKTESQKDGDIKIEEITYNSESLKKSVKVTRVKNGVPHLDQILEFQYTDNNQIQLEKKTTYNSAGEIHIVYKEYYDYDDHGNWIKYEELMNDATTMLKVREIEFFP